MTELPSRLVLPGARAGELNGIEQTAVAATAHPPGRGGGFELTPALLVRSPGLDPIGEDRPRMEQDLMGEIDANIAVLVIAGDGHQAVGDETLQDNLEY